MAQPDAGAAARARSSAASRLASFGTVRRRERHPPGRRAAEGPDSSWGDFQGALLARMLAVIDAQAAVARGEPSARHALRQACIDLASAAELVAEELPRPRV